MLLKWEKTGDRMQDTREPAGGTMDAGQIVSLLCDIKGKIRAFVANLKPFRHRFTLFSYLYSLKPCSSVSKNVYEKWVFVR